MLLIEEAQLILKYLDDREDMYVIIDDVYIYSPDGELQSRLILAIAFFSKEQIRQARRFISRYIVQSDATFNTNDKRLLLSNVVGLDNRGKTFPAMYLFHVNESTRLSRWIMTL